MHNLEPYRTPTVQPVPWSGLLVRERLREAFEFERRLPGSRRSSSAWPFPVIYSFADLVGRTNPPEPVRLRGATAAEITRMDEALGWLRILAGYPLERRDLAAWAACSGSVRLMLERRNIPRATFYRNRNAGSERIAAVLNSRGLEVR